VVYQPTALGAANDAFDIPSDDPDEASVTVQVSGTGTPVPAPDIVVTDSVAPTDDLIVAFGNLPVGDSATQTVTVTNSASATASLVLGTIGAGNGLAAPYSVANDTCSGQTLAAGGSCTFDVQFQPTSTTPANDALAGPAPPAGHGRPGGILAQLVRGGPQRDARLLPSSPVA
jgi:hypothetical protein